MSTDFTLHDPLHDQPVAIAIQLLPGSNRDERPALVTLGIPGQRPVSTTGRFADLPELIHRVWQSFGLQVTPVAPIVTGAEAEETIAEVVVTPARPSPADPPRPQATNLSLF